MSPDVLTDVGALFVFMSEHESFVKQKLSGVALRSKDPERSEWAS